MKKLACFARALAAVGAIALHSAAPPAAAAPLAPLARPTIVLVHGAFAESASWNKVARNLRARSFPVIAKTVVVKGGSHVVMISKPNAVSRLIVEAAEADAAQP